MEKEIYTAGSGKRFYRLLYELSNNCRISRKELGMKLKISQQQVTYLINKLRNDNIIRSDAVIDPARFGLINILVKIVFIDFNIHRKKEILRTFGDCEYITSITEVTGGVDLIMEYSVPNLSFFNKLCTSQMDDFSKDLKMIGAYPVIVKHLYGKNYLHKRDKTKKHIIICGDRETATLSGNETQMIKELVKDPAISMTKISNNIGMDPRTGVKMFKRIKGNIIKDFFSDIALEKVGVLSEYFFVKLHEDKQKISNKISNLCHEIPEVTEVIKIIGDKDLMIKIETFGSCDKILRMIQDELRFYEYVSYRYKKLLKQTRIPLLEI